MISGENQPNDFAEGWLVILGKSGGERAAVQTLREVVSDVEVAKRLECDGFSIAFGGQPPQSASGATYL